MIGKIAVSAANFAIDKPYSYAIPEGMVLSPGQRVMIPFGRGNRRCEGVVLSLEAGDAHGLKAVEQVLDEESLLSPTMLRLAAFVRERYFCTFYEAVRVMLPAGLWFKEKNTYRLTEDTQWKEKSFRQENALALLTCLENMGGQAEEHILRNVVPDEEEFHTAVQYLLKKKWISGKVSLLRQTRDKTEKIATLAASAEEAMEFASHRPKTAAMQKSVLELMCSLGSVSVKELCYYTGATAATVNRLVELGYLELSDKQVLRCREIRPAVLDGPLVLNEEQQTAYCGLEEQMHREKPGVALLYGVTGSGKTAVYLKLIQRCLDDGKSALLLVPEIGLTPQLLSLMAAHFGNRVAVQHSSLPAGERNDQWKRIASGEAKVVVGTRSAVFAPGADFGIIIMDEEQEHSYQSENSPRYSTKEVAIWRGIRENALVLLGSATPSVESMFRAKNGDYQLYTLKNRFGGRALPRVSIVDMGEEAKNGNDSIFSWELQDAIGKTHAGGKQSILFLNRRGNSRALVCVDCREAPECTRCSAKLTYHSANERLMCHYCGYSVPVPARCPQCSGPLKRVGTGTQKAQQELQTLFPEMEIARMDADTVSALNTHEKILDRFQNDRIPVLIGTQMVAKGLNLPDVTLVGVLDADRELYSGSYRAAETTFNMLTQVVGRAGRGDAPGEALIQTLVPNHKIIELAARQDYDGFFELEQQLRRVQECPPFGDLATVTFLGQEEARVLRGAAKFRDSLNTCLKQAAYQGESCRVLGPAPCVVPKINYNFRYRLTLRCQMTRPLRQLIAHLLRQFMQDKENRGVGAFVDVNGLDE
ncbi:MAG: primosomal protein N' [Ruminococcaceae bacterium]|nr:primosomal protein N' [Oscillospiraceae bacterium]